MPWLNRRRPAAEPDVEAAAGTGDLSSDVVELTLCVSRETAARLEAGVSCREVRIERLGDDRIALLLWASNREQWLLQVAARAERAAHN